jgi:hypothetical protein
VLVLIVVAALVGGFFYLGDLTSGPQLRSYSGGLQQTLDDLRGAIQDNTR